jgi:mannan polymerase II complex MNN10 subunit
MYATQPFIRSAVGFLPQRTINAFPPGACQGYEERKDIFYNEKDHDFLVNMAGCSYVAQPFPLIVDGDVIVSKK